MKKKIVILFAILIVVAVAVSLVACNRSVVDGEVSDISRVTESYFAGENEYFAVSIESGKREKMFIADGKTTDVVPFTEIKITPLKTCEEKSVSFVVCGGENTLEGKIEESAHGEFKGSVTLDFTPEKVTVAVGETQHEIELKNVLEGAIAPDEALKIARETFKDKLEAEAAEGKTREVYLKLITGDRANYYYYVSFIGDGINYLAALISPSGEIVSKRD